MRYKLETKFDFKEPTKEVLSIHDDVDRSGYVDNATRIYQMLASGINYKEHMMLYNNPDLTLEERENILSRKAHVYKSKMSDIENRELAVELNRRVSSFKSSYEMYKKAVQTFNEKYELHRQKEALDKELIKENLKEKRKSTKRKK